MHGEHRQGDCFGLEKLCGAGAPHAHSSLTEISSTKNKLSELKLTGVKTGC